MKSLINNIILDAILINEKDYIRCVTISFLIKEIGKYPPVNITNFDKFYNIKLTKVEM